MTASGNPPWRIHIATTSRADFGIYRSVLQAMVDDPELDPGLLVSGMHLSPEFGMTVSEIEASGFEIRDQFEILVSSDSAEGLAKSMGLATISMAQSLARDPCDLVLVLGDRFEMHALVVAALPFRIPVAHIAGGDETEGAIDNAFRHSITKLSHLHFCTTELAASRVRAMGEDPARVFNAGTPALDGVTDMTFLTRAELAERFHPFFAGDFFLSTYHPVTLDPEGTLEEFDRLGAVLARQDLKTVLTLANADTAGRAMNQRIKALAAAHPGKIGYVDHMGKLGYFSAMNEATAMIGNSSSGIYEAAAFGLPVVNIGIRQDGRERSPNTIDTDGTEAGIADAIAEALSDAHKSICARRENIYGSGQAGALIAREIKAFLAGDHGVRKSFHGLPPHG